MPQELLFELKGARVTPHIATSRGAWGRKPFSQDRKETPQTRMRDVFRGITCAVPSRWLRECRPSGVRPLLGLNLRGKCQVSSGDLALRYPITGIAGCCARAASGHAAAPPMSVTNSRLRSPRRRGRLVGGTVSPSQGSRAEKETRG